MPADHATTSEIQCKSLGMKVEVFDPSGNNVEHTGQPGELVCTRPHPSIPVCFWGDESGEKFRDAYFGMYPGKLDYDHSPLVCAEITWELEGVWRQGDFMVVNPRTKGIMILGRRSVNEFLSNYGLTDTLSATCHISDGVLNPSGVRFGSGEIYSVLEQFTALLDDSLCVGQRRPHDKDERVLLFLKMRAGHKFTGTLVDRIRSAIRTRLSARHVPAFIFEIEDIPVRRRLLFTVSEFYLTRCCSTP